MSYNINDIVYEQGDYFVLRVKKGYEIYRTGITHATRCAQIGWPGDEGRERSIKEVNRRLMLGE